jgi:Rrf2 family protein
MKLSAKAEYACLAVIALAQQGAAGQPVRVREIADAHTIPERYLVQILLHLKAAGLVQSARGAAGGYCLARPPEQITLGEVLSAIDGPTKPLREAQGVAERALASVLEEIRDIERAALARTTIAQIASQVEPQDWVI